MADQYTNFDGGSDDDENGDDDDIGALGSILSWDEDEDNTEGVATAVNQALNERDALERSVLPDLVSFNAKDGLNSAYLQQLLNTNGTIVSGARDVKSGNDTSHLSIPMPTPINFGNSNSTSSGHAAQLAQQQQPQQPQLSTTSESDLQNGSTSQQQLNSSNLAQLKPAAISIPPPAITNQPALMQQQQPQLQQQFVGSASQVAQPPQQQNQAATNTATNHQQQLPLAQMNQLLQQASNAKALFPQGFPFFQQGALMAQNQGQMQPQQVLSMPSAMSALMMQTAAQAMAQDRNPQQQQSQHPQQNQQQQQQMPQFTFTTDPNAFIRQLQVAQLQQQFNAVQQQARPLAQQTMGSGASASGNQTPSLQQQQGFPVSQLSAPSPQPATAPQLQAQSTIQGQTQHQSQPQPSSHTQVPSQSALPPMPTAKKGRAATKKSRAASNRGSKSAPESMCNAARAPIVSASDTDGEPSSAGATGTTNFKHAKTSASAKLPNPEPIDMSDMTPEEKAKANRDRNREHARNTRLRKKAYLEKLKTTVDALCRERDSLVADRAGAANILVEMHNTRTEVLMSFFALRSANEKRRELWASILDESCFSCVIPVTPYRSFPASEVQVSKCQRTILGIDGMMSDTASLHVLLNSLVDRSRFPNATITFRYTLVTEEAVVAGNQMMARWVMSTLNATQCGARMEIAKQGMLCCKFNSSHKIIGLELMFDVMALMLQLKQAAGSDTFSVIPNTVQTCQRSFDMPMVMTLAEEPYTIVQVNKLWEDMSGYRADEVVGKASCHILEGEETDPSATEALMNEIRFKRPASAMVVNYRKFGERFRNFFLAFPLSTDSRISHYLFLSNTVTSCGPSTNQSQVQSQQAQLAHSFNAALSRSAPNDHQPRMMLGNAAKLLNTLTSSERNVTQPIYTMPSVSSNSLPTNASMQSPAGIGFPEIMVQKQQQLTNANPLKRAGDSHDDELPNKDCRRHNENNIT